MIKKILTEWSYRLDDGIINLNNPKHLLILSEVLKDMKLPTKVILEVMSNLTEKKKSTPLSQKDKDKMKKMGLIWKGKGYGKEGEKGILYKNVDGKLVKSGDGETQKTKPKVNVFPTDKPADTSTKTEPKTDEKPLEVDEKSEIGTTDNWKSEIEKSEKRIKTLNDKLEKAKKTGNKKKIAKAQKELDKEIREKEGFEMNQKVTKGLNEGNFDVLTEAQDRTENLRDKGIAGMGGKKASQGESRTVNASNTLPKYNDQYSDEEGVKKVNDKKEQIKNRVNKKGKPNYPNNEEKEMLKTLGFDDPNSDEALEYFAKRELYAEEELERAKNDPDSVFNSKDGFNGDEEAYREWMRTSYDSAMCIQEDLEHDSNIDTSKPHRVLQSTDGASGQDVAIKKHLLDKYEEEKKKCGQGTKESCKNAKHYKRQYELMSKLGFHDTFAIGQDKNGRTTIYHISNKKATDISDPHNNTTPKERINVIKKAGFGEKVSILVGQTLETGLERVSDVKSSTTRNITNIPVDENTAKVAEKTLKTDGTRYLDDIDDNVKFQKWAKENNISLETTEDKLKAIQSYVKSEIERTGKPPAYNPFGKIFAKIGENARKKKFQSENPDIDYESQGIQDSIETKQTEKNAVKKTYDEVVDSITKADEQEGFPDEEGNNGPNTQAYLTTVFDSMHVNKYIDNYDGDATIVVGGRSVKPRHIRECLAEKTGYDMPPGDRKGLKEHLKKKCRIDSESGGIIVKGKDGDVRLFKDEWRSAGTSSQKVASYYEDDMKECMKDKVDADRKANREKNGLGKQ